ncbi:uncharacterized protein LOC141598341 [Silene latifolia]|uniref:uncharacterized protein LOC141598341 n=1 Tax=Silene latifolia TaxID=37657 RepID=UPI003D77CFDC
MLGSLCAQTVFVPIDVVSQKLKVNGYSSYTAYNGGLDVVRKVVKSNGIRGLYRGSGLLVMTYSPSKVFVWWASYGSSQHLFLRMDTQEMSDLLKDDIVSEQLTSLWWIQLCQMATFMRSKKSGLPNV